MPIDLGDLFQLFPDLPWHRALVVPLAVRQQLVADSVRQARAAASRARARFLDHTAQYAAATARRRRAVDQRWRRKTR